VADKEEDALREEAEARDRLREAEAEAGQTLEEAEELERELGDESVAEPAEAVAEEEGIREAGQGEREH
jgi:hypothetical protein